MQAALSRASAGGPVRACARGHARGMKLPGLQFFEIAVGIFEIAGFSKNIGRNFGNCQAAIQILEIGSDLFEIANSFWKLEGILEIARSANFEIGSDFFEIANDFWKLEGLFEKQQECKVCKCLEIVYDF